MKGLLSALTRLFGVCYFGFLTYWIYQLPEGAAIFPFDTPTADKVNAMLIDVPHWILMVVTGALGIAILTSEETL